MEERKEESWKEERKRWRMEEGVNIKVVQDVLGHKDVKTTLNIYTDVTKELKQEGFAHLQEKMNRKKQQKEEEGNASFGEDGLVSAETAS